MMEIEDENRHLVIKGDNLSGLNLINGIRYFDFLIIDPIRNRDELNNLNSNLLDDIEDKLCISKDIMTDNGVIAIYVNYKDYRDIKNVMDKVFGKSNYRNSFLLNNSDLLLVYSKSNNFKYNEKYIENKLKIKGHINQAIKKIEMKPFNNFNKYLSNISLNNFLNNFFKGYEDLSNRKGDILVDKDDTKELINYFNPYTYSKSLDNINNNINNLNRVIKIIDLFTDSNSKIFDFYSSNCEISRAVLELNLKDNGNRVVTLITNDEGNILLNLGYSNKDYSYIKIS